jgi:transcriptional regulator with XRE-family HTH domain
VRIKTLHDPRYKRIVRRLIKARLDANLTQEELGRMTGLSQPDVSKIEKCQRRIDVLEVVDWIEATKAPDLVDIPGLLDGRR